MASVPVNVDNFVRAETARMFDGQIQRSGGVNAWDHARVPTPIDAQTVIRMNRDTLYSAAIVDISASATVTLPEAAGRYMTMMVVNEDHYIDRIFSEPGTYELTVDEFDTPFVAIVVRTLVEPGDPEDVAEVNTLQDALTLEASSARPYEHLDYDEVSRKATFEALAALSTGLPSASRMFGRKDEVDPVRHLIGTAIGWGGLPESAAFYVPRTEPRAIGCHTLTLRDVPVDGFWSLAIYNRDGFFESNPYDSYGINSVTATPDEDGSVTINLSSDEDGLANHVYIMEGWNYVLRFYEPRQEILDGTWNIPEIVPAL